VALKSRFEGRRWLKLRYFLRRAYHLFLFWQKEEGLAPFLARHKAEGLWTLSREARALAPSFEKCQVCSLCTFTCAAVRDGTAPPAFEPKYLLVALGRAPELSVEEWVPCAACTACTVECPVDVPIHAMAQSIVEGSRRFAEITAEVPRPTEAPPERSA
jgi:heterodisulfide reductase subunit C